MKTIGSKASVSLNSNMMFLLQNFARLILTRLSPSQRESYRILVHQINCKLIGRSQFLTSSLLVFGDDEYLKERFIEVANFVKQVKYADEDLAIPDHVQENNNNNIPEIQEDHCNDAVNEVLCDDWDNVLEKNASDFLNKIEKVDSEILKSVVQTLIGYKEGKIRVQNVKPKILSLLSNHEDLIDELEEILKTMEAIMMEKSKRKRRSSPRESRGTTCN